MILTRLSITNFGVYRELNEFDLRPKTIDGETIPVVLFGGKNGAGKTTILDAIRLCLYGQLALGNRVRQSDYEAYIQRHFHKDRSGIPVANKARVSIRFEHTHVGKHSVYDATRAWWLDNDTFQEKVTIYKDGGLLEETASDHWNDFLRDLIPPGVANLFFFDGEQIQSLASDETEADSLQIAVKGLLNLDLVDRLKADLSLYLKGKGNKDRSDLEKQAHELESSFQELEVQRLNLVQDRAGLNAQYDGISNRLEKSRQVLLSEGAVFVQQRTKNEQRLEKVKEEILEANQAVHELAGGLLPFAATPAWSQKLKQRLVSEAKIEEDRISLSVQQQRASEIAIKLLDKSFQDQTAPDVSAQDWATIASEIQNLLLPASSIDDTPILHSLTVEQRRQLIAWIDSAVEQLPAQMKGLTDKSEALEREERSLSKKIQQVPSDEVANPLISEFESLSRQQGELEEQRKQIEKEMSQLEHQLAEADRNRKKCWETLSKSEDADIRVQRAAKVQVILDEYLAQITEVKLTELEQQIAYYFNLLCRKNMAIEEVKIDRKSFMVRLYGKNRVELAKSSLSAGEKQLYAMALLWALRSVSGRNLPIIIDTPMGRLDSEHRQALLTRFFPEAAHQIIMLSTDTEIDADAYALLQPTISHAFALEFDDEKGCTTVVDGYFRDGKFAELGSTNGTADNVSTGSKAPSKSIQSTDNKAKVAA